VVSQLTENIDVLPTLLARLGEPLPPGTRVDGRAQLAADGSACPSCGKLAAFYAWEDYRAIRGRRHLLRENLPGSFHARCDGADQLFAVDGGRRALAPAPPLAERLRRHLQRRLDGPRRAFLSSRYGTPTSSFVLRPQFWRVEDDLPVACVPVSGDTPAAALRAPGWLWTEHGLALLDRDGALPLAAAVDVPDGAYVVELASVPVARMPWLVGFASWRKASFAKEDATTFVPIGTARARAGRLRVDIAPDVAQGLRIVGLRITPEGVVPASAAPLDDDQRRRLRALGYVQ
jgi:hypothetical protein